MIGLLASYWVVSYLLVPSGLFRSFYSLFVPHIKFQRTRGEEFTFAAIASILPFFLALGLVWSVANWPFGAGKSSSTDRRDAYRIVISAAMSGRGFEDQGHTQVYWVAANQVIRRQARFLFWYYLLVSFEAWICAWLTRNYGRWSESLTGMRGRLYAWMAAKILLPAVSEWHLLLTPLSYPPEPAREVWVDVLTTIDILYNGHVIDFFLNKEGELSGIFLEYPRRFDRQGYLRDAERQKITDTDSYWRKIPSNNLYIPNEKIVNLNVRYLTEDEITALQASWLLMGEGLDVAAGE